MVSALALQFVNDLPGTLIQIRRALKPDGLFLAAMIGGESLTELREAFAAGREPRSKAACRRASRRSPTCAISARLLQRAGFALPVTDVDRVTVRYASPLALMHDLRRMGAANALTERRRMPLRRATLRRLLEIYAERFADPDGRIRATFEIVWLSGWAPHESQQKPLSRARPRRGWPMRCNAEISAGEKAGLARTSASCREQAFSCEHVNDRRESPTPERSSRIRSRWRRSRRRRTAVAAVEERSTRHAVTLHSSVIRCAISGSSAGGIL